MVTNAKLKQINADRDWWCSACAVIGATLTAWTYRTSATASFEHDCTSLDVRVAKPLVALWNLIRADYNLNDVTTETLETLKEIRAIIATKKKPKLTSKKVSLGPWKAQMLKSCGNFGGGPVVWDSRIFDDPCDVPWGSWGCDLLQFRTIEQAYRVRNALNSEVLYQVRECLAWRGDETKEQLLAFIQDAQGEIEAAITKAEKQ